MGNPIMQYTYLGRTGVKVSRLCLGCMSYGDPRWRPWVLDEQSAMPFFRKAIVTTVQPAKQVAEACRQLSLA